MEKKGFRDYFGEATEKALAWKNKEGKIVCPSCNKEIKSKKGNFVPAPGMKCPSCGKKMVELKKEEVEEPTELSRLEIAFKKQTE